MTTIEITRKSEDGTTYEDTAILCDNYVTCYWCGDETSGCCTKCSKPICENHCCVEGNEDRYNEYYSNKKWKYKYDFLCIICIENAFI